MLHRVREACGRGHFTLKEVVEVDETYIGGKESAKHNNKKMRAGRGTVGKVPVVGMRERGGRVKALPVTAVNKVTLQNLIANNVDFGATVYTDEHGGYKGLDGLFFRHESVKHSVKEYVNGGMCHINGVESVWALLKRSIHGTWHHVSPKHLNRYIQEASFRLNEGNVEIDTMDRMESLVRKIAGGKLTYKKLTADNGLSHHVQAVQ